MNWIKSKPFVSGLAGITLLLCGILYFLASKWGAQYAETKAGFDDAYLGVNTAEGLLSILRPISATAKARR